jgi:hypothetical protein
VTYLVKVPRRLAVQVDDKVGSTTLTGLAGPLTLTSQQRKHRRHRAHQRHGDRRANAGTIILGFTVPPTTVEAQTQVGSVTVRLPASTTYAIDTGSQVSVADVKFSRTPGSPHRVTAHSQVGSVSVYNG